MFLDNVTLVRFFFFFFFFFSQTLLFNCNSFTLVANKYLLTYLLTYQMGGTAPLIVEEFSADDLSEI